MDEKETIGTLNFILGNVGVAPMDPTHKVRAFILMNNVSTWGFGRIRELVGMLKDHNLDQDPETRKYCLDEIEKILNRVRDENNDTWKNAQHQME